MEVQVKNNLSFLRRKAGLTQTRLASLCGVSKNCISAVETGRWFPTLKLALMLSYVLMVSVHDLFWLVDPEDEWLGDAYSCSCDDPASLPCAMSHEHFSCDCCCYGVKLFPIKNLYKVR